ncbi:MAG: hypothetical protein RMY34_23280 [Aulosira sp. DedQUE10]|nr:hypothetical protein [Aulosira sp. DedQUE10]
MKVTKALKIVVIPVLAVLSFVSTANTALADYLNSEGNGGEYRYELWSTDDGSAYYLKIWDRDAAPESSPNATTRAFESSRKALIYFDCNYAKKNLAECNQ